MKSLVIGIIVIVTSVHVNASSHRICHMALSTDPMHPLVTLFQKIESSGVDVDDISFKVDVQYESPLNHEYTDSYDFEPDPLALTPFQISVELRLENKGILNFELDEIENGYARGALFKTGTRFQKGTGLGSLLYLFVATFVYFEHDLLLQSDSINRSVSDPALAVWDRFVDQGMATAGLGRSRTFSTRALETVEFRRLHSWFAQRRESDPHFTELETNLPLQDWLIEEFSEAAEWEQIFESHN